jgi:uncharacterized protein YPO0396
MNWIEQIITALLKWLQGLAREDKTVEEAKPQQDLRDDLRRRIDDHEQRLRQPSDFDPQR